MRPEVRLQAYLPGTLSRSLRLLTLFVILACCLRLHASASLDTILPDEQTLLQLEQRALQAQPREQCFLFTELVHVMTEIAGKEMLEGNVEQASARLKRVEHYARLIHLGLANDTKRLKSAEQLMQHTTYRLNGLLRAASSEDRETLKATLKQLDQVQDELLTQVFKH